MSTDPGTVTGVRRPERRRAPDLSRLRRLLGDPIPKETLAGFFDRLALLLAAGQSVPEALRGAAGPGDAEMRAIAEAAAGPTAHGMPLHRALAPWAARFPEIVLPVVEVGEVSGTLEGAARRLSDTFARATAVERQMRFRVFSPWYVALALALVLAAPMLALDPARGLADIARTLATLGVLWVTGRLALRLLWRCRPLRVAVDTVKLALPHVGVVVRNLAAARWGRSFATLWHAGVPISAALEVSSRSVLNACYEDALLRAARETREGRTLIDSLAGTQMLPAHLLAVLHAGEVAGATGAALDRFVGTLEDEALTRATKEFTVTVAVAEVLLIVMAAAAMGGALGR